VTFEVIHLLKAFSNGICYTVVQQLTTGLVHLSCFHSNN